MGISEHIRNRSRPERTEILQEDTQNSPAQSRKRSHASISAAIPPFLFQRRHLSKIHADLIHTLQLTENPLHGVFCVGGYKNQRCNMEAEKTDVAHNLTLPGLWHLPCSSQRLGRARVLFWREILTLSAWLRGGGLGGRGFPWLQSSSAMSVTFPQKSSPGKPRKVSVLAPNLSAIGITHPTVRSCILSSKCKSSRSL